MQFQHAFVVKAPPDRVWAFLTDPYRVAPALPGASITEKVDERTWAGGITVKVGPVSAKYRGTVRFESLDPAARAAEVVARGQDTSGRGGADMKMTSRVTERPGGESEVTVVSEVNVTGIMAQFGRGLMQDVSDQMLQRFTEAMRAELEKPEAPEPAAAPVAPGAVGVASATDLAGTPAPASPAAPRPAAAPIDVLSFGSGVVGRAALRGLRHPLFWIVVAALVVLALYWVWLS